MGASDVPDVGRLIRRLRRHQGLTLKQVAEATGLSASFLSEVERGESDIAFGRLARIAGFFGHDVGSLLGYSGRGGRPHFVDDADRLAVDRGDGIEYRVIRTPATGYELITATFGPRTAFREPLVHEGIESVVVPFGELVLVYDGADYVMPAGRCAVFSGGFPHLFRNDTDAPAQFLSVVSDTVF
jgi:transcriptional regulator with XRE-family HTH domain